MTIDEMIAVLQAAKEGKQIQFRKRRGEIWSEPYDGNTLFQWDFSVYTYRVKPEPREWLIDEAMLDAYNLKQAGRTEKQSWEIKVREVLE